MQEIPHEERGRQPHPTKLFEAPNGAGSPSHVVSASHSPHRHDNTRRDGSSSRATGRCSTRCVHALSFTAKDQAWLAAGKTTASPRPIGVTSFAELKVRIHPSPAESQERTVARANERALKT